MLLRNDGSEKYKYEFSQSSAFQSSSRIQCGELAASVMVVAAENSYTWRECPGEVQIELHCGIHVFGWQVSVFPGKATLGALPKEKTGLNVQFGR
jgi:hypothetical protein